MFVRGIVYKILIVDDEQEVRQGIISKTKWSEFCFELIGEASNGQEALEIIEKQIPDIVITDISMPLMDGLELSKEIKEQYPIVKTIILTGYEDFTFAQKAIKYGVEDYLSKPIHPNEMNSLLSKLKKILDDEIKEKEDVKKLQKHYEQSLPILKERFLFSLIHKTLNYDEIESGIKLYNINILYSNFTISVSKIDIGSIKKKEMAIELRNIAILRITKKIIKEKNCGEVFFYNNLLIIIFSIDSKEKAIIRNKVISFLEEIHQNIKHFLKITLSTGLGYIQNSINLLPSTFVSAKTALEYRLLLGGSKVIFIEDVEPDLDISLNFDEEKESKLLNAIKFETENNIKQVVMDILKYDKRTSIAIKDYQLYFLQIVSFLIRQANILQIDSSLLLQEVSDLFSKIITFATMEQVINWLINICLEFKIELDRKRVSSTQRYISKAKNYINEKFNDHELSIQKLADILYISPSYLGMIFKKEAKVTFLQYLIKIRLKKAKLFLENPVYSISDVANKVGYPDISYFSYFFKKNIGISPREYKKKYMKEGNNN